MRQFPGEWRISVLSNLLQSSCLRLGDDTDFVAERDESNRR